MTDQPIRDVTNRFLGEPYLRNNGLGGYSVVRDTPKGTEYAQISPELKTEIIKSMQAARAGGRYGSDDDPSWYPIDSSFVPKISFGVPQETSFDVEPRQDIRFKQSQSKIVGRSK